MSEATRIAKDCEEWAVAYAGACSDYLALLTTLEAAGEHAPTRRAMVEARRLKNRIYCHLLDRLHEMEDHGLGDVAAAIRVSAGRNADLAEQLAFRESFAAASEVA